MGHIDTAGVIGAGTMGSGIAQKLAQEGLQVILVDRTEADLERGRARIAGTLDQAVERRILDRAAADETLARIQTTVDKERLQAAGLIIEAIFEDLQAKSALFQELGAILPAETILATNTSSFFVRELAAVTAVPERVVGLHYFYHPAKNRLVEVVPHETTGASVFQAAWALQERIGKTPIRCADAPGFCVNRFFVPWLNEACRLLEEGVAGVAAIDRVARDAFRIGLGPFALMNATGVPIALHAATTLGKQLGPFYAPAPSLARQVERGARWELGGSDDCGDAAAEAIRTRLFGAVFYVAAQLVEDGVASIEDTDIGAKVGLRWSKGPFELMNRVGVARAAAMAEAVIAPHGLSVPASLRDRAGSGELFAISRVRLETEGGVATITIQRPEAMNALNEELVEQLAVRFEEAVAQKGVEAVVIRGAGKGFVAGADVRWFVRQIDADNVSGIVAFTEAGQRLFSRFAEVEPVVIAFVDGVSLGGGSELALACDYIVATERGSFGFPETGIGIYPGLGGTQRLPRRVGRGLSRYLVHTGRSIPAGDAASVGLVDRLIRPGDLAVAVAELQAHGKPGERRPSPLPSPWSDVAAAFDHPVAELLDGIHAANDPAVRKRQQSLRWKAPIALRVADRLIAQALSTELAGGLAAELAALPEIFGTKDAYVGLSSLGGRERPVFEGH